MQVIESIAKLIRPAENIALRKRTLPARLHLEEVLARDVLHHQKLAFVLSKVIAHARQGLMMKTRQQPGFALELFPHFSSVKQRSFKATTVSSRKSTASYTAPIPPWPSWRTMR
jgi:hypothetical protein